MARFSQEIVDIMFSNLKQELMLCYVTIAIEIDSTQNDLVKNSTNCKFTSIPNVMRVEFNHGFDTDFLSIESEGFTKDCQNNNYSSLQNLSQLIGSWVERKQILNQPNFISKKIYRKEIRKNEDVESVKLHKEFSFPQLTVNLEKLNLSNRIQLNAIQNLSKLIIRIERMDFLKIDDASNNISNCLKPSLATNKKGLDIISKIGSECRVKLRQNIDLKVHIPFPTLFIKLERFDVGKNDSRPLLKYPDKILKLMTTKKPMKVAQGKRIYKYKCPQCTYKTWSLTGVQIHQTAVHGHKICQTYHCPDCDYTSNWPNRIKNHQVKHKNEGDLSCPECSYKTKYDQSLRNHIKLRHLPIEEAGVFQCSICKFRAVRRALLQRHISAHEQKKFELQFTKPPLCPQKPKVYKCQHCMYETLEKWNLDQHKYRSHGEEIIFKKDVYKCEECSYITKYSWIFSDHLLTHRNPDELPTFHCDKCSYKTNLKRLFRRHIRRQHNVSKQYHCSDCSYKTYNQECFKSHFFRNHRKTEPHLFCDQCPYKTTKNCFLLNHKIRHMGPEESKIMYHCEKCNYLTNRKGYYTRHLKVHHTKPEDVKWHCCDSCSYKSKALGDLRRHKKRHDAMFYECKICNKKIMNHKQNFKRHMLIHLDREQLKTKIELCTCYCCGLKTKKDYIRRHLQHCSKYLLYKLSL